MSGRPLRFLAGAGVAWVGWRVVMLWPQATTIPAPLFAPAPFAAAQTPFLPRDALWGDRRPWPVQTSRGATGPAVAAVPRIADTPRPSRPGAARDRDRIALAMAALVGMGPPPPPVGQSTVPRGLPEEASATADHWSGSAWLVLRGGNAPATGLTRGQLGGGQAGLRVAYALGGSRALAVVARATSPTRGPGHEASIGVEWRPTRLPVRLVAEQRAAIDGGRGGPALGVIGGFGPAPLAAGFDLESYAQGGAVRRARTEPFVEGAARLSHPVATAGHARIDLGLGVSGGAQRDAARFDVGPSIGVRLPLGKQPVRLTLDWRERVAGGARPGSGLALTLGSDF